MFFYLSYNPYIAIIGDIKNSKKIHNRLEVQSKLQKILDKINIKYENHIASKFMITLGDEFQGLLKAGENLMEIISEIEGEMYPIKLRFGIGVGEINTEINKDIPLGADGPAYYNARKAIELIRNNENKSKSPNPNIKLVVEGKYNNSTELINTIFSLLSTIENKWTDRQREIIYDYISHKDNQSKVAERLSITQSSVQKSLSKANFYAYEDAINTVSKALKEIKRREYV